MQGHLRIGAVAQLLGITTKTVRHYHKLGLLREPDRTAAGYRLYDAHDLLRLHQIRRLQALGLALHQIRTVLGTPESAPTLRGVLGALRDDVERQIALLVARREEIDHLLAGGLEQGLEEPRPAPATLAWLDDLLDAHLPEASAAVREQEERVLALLDSFAWPSEYVAGWHGLAEHYAAHPEALHGLHALSERLAALAHQPSNPAVLRELAADFQRYQREYPLPTALLPDFADPGQPFARAFGDLLRARLSPAQQQLMALLDDPSHTSTDPTMTASQKGASQ